MSALSGPGRDEQPRRSASEPYTIARDALRERWKGEATPREVVGWIFDALDEAGDHTVIRTDEARQEAVVMAGQVFSDLAHEPGVDQGALVSNVLRSVDRFAPRNKPDGWRTDLCVECKTPCSNGTDTHPPLCETCVAIWYPADGRGAHDAE